MSFQSPVEVPGVSNAEFLRISANARRMAQGLPELDPLEFYGFITPKVCDLHWTDSCHIAVEVAKLQSLQQRTQQCKCTCCGLHKCTVGALTNACTVQLQSLNMDASFLDRNVNEGFSGIGHGLNLCLCLLQQEVSIILRHGCMLLISQWSV